MTMNSIRQPDETKGSRAAGTAPRRRFHRVRSIRLRQGMSLRSAARRMGVRVSQVRALEDETVDLPLSVLYVWQQVLDVPVPELLNDEDEDISAPLLRRARMLKIMKTARAILDNSESPQLERLTQRLIDQLIEVMPELEGIHSWQSTGQRRTLDDVGRIAENPFPDHLLMDGSEV